MVVDTKNAKDWLGGCELSQMAKCFYIPLPGPTAGCQVGACSKKIVDGRLSFTLPSPTKRRGSKLATTLKAKQWPTGTNLSD